MNKWPSQENPRNSTGRQSTRFMTYGAARAYDEKAKEVYGDFAILNFPTGEERTVKD
jgi:hypothetical protein